MWRVPGENHLMFRIQEIEASRQYSIDDPNRPGHGELHRILTTLLNPQMYYAIDLIGHYHQRWKIELAIDEIDTHQRLTAHTLRSLKPVGVIAGIL